MFDAFICFVQGSIAGVELKQKVHYNSRIKELYHQRIKRIKKIRGNIIDDYIGWT